MVEQVDNSQLKNQIDEKRNNISSLLHGLYFKVNEHKKKLNEKKTQESTVEEKNQIPEIIDKNELCTSRKSAITFHEKSPFTATSVTAPTVFTYKEAMSLNTPTINQFITPTTPQIFPFTTPTVTKQDISLSTTNSSVHKHYAYNRSKSAPKKQLSQTCTLNTIQNSSIITYKELMNKRTAYSNIHKQVKASSTPKLPKIKEKEIADFNSNPTIPVVTFPTPDKLSLERMYVHFFCVFFIIHIMIFNIHKSIIYNYICIFRVLAQYYHG
jgi:hypothetical protein